MIAFSTSLSPGRVYYKLTPVLALVGVAFYLSDKYFLPATAIARVPVAADISTDSEAWQRIVRAHKKVRQRQVVIATKGVTI